jgi:hypothetical protein
VRVGREGFNGTLSGSADALRSFAEHLKKFDRHFEETDFKFIDGLASDKHFKDLKVVPVQVRKATYPSNSIHTILSVSLSLSLSPPPRQAPPTS